MNFFVGSEKQKKYRANTPVTIPFGSNLTGLKTHPAKPFFRLSLSFFRHFAYCDATLHLIPWQPIRQRLSRAGYAAAQENVIHNIDAKQNSPLVSGIESIHKV
ncbi:MAG: hypothetical protein AB9917_00240 [Negativicutes bacterium]